MKHCGDCGKEMKEGAKFCGSCGATTVPKSAPETAETSQQGTAAPSEATPSEISVKARGAWDALCAFIKDPSAANLDIEAGATTNSLIFFGAAILGTMLFQISLIQTINRTAANAIGGIFGSGAGGATSDVMSNVLPLGTIITYNVIVGLLVIGGFLLCGLLFGKVAKAQMSGKEIFILAGYATIPYTALMLFAALICFLGVWAAPFGALIAMLAAPVVYLANYLALLVASAKKNNIVANSLFVVVYFPVFITALVVLQVGLGAAVAGNIGGMFGDLFNFF